MDPQARHSTWSLLQKFKKERKCTILLTTHFMDEVYNIINYLRKFDVVFPVMHGTNAEDGRMQGFLDLFDITEE